MTRPLPWRPALGWLGLVLVLAALLPARAVAHQGSTKSIELWVDEPEVRMQVAVAAVDAAVELDLGLEVVEPELRDAAPFVEQWLAGGLVLRSDAGLCTAEAAPARLEVRDERRLVVLDFAYECPSPLGTLALLDRTIYDDEPKHRALVSVHWGDRTQVQVLRGGAPQVFVVGGPEVTITAAGLLHEGAHHLITGPDHLLFLLSLILTAALVVRRDGLSCALVDVTWVVTAFTVGHSLSLVAATLELVALPSREVEIAIAASIVVAALFNLVRPEAPAARTRRARVTMAVVFGLVHGFGLSSVLAEASLPTSHRVLALLAFNVGIEVAQLAFVVTVLGPLVLAARWPVGYRRFVVRGGSLLIAACGLAWLVERSLGPLL